MDEQAQIVLTSKGGIEYIPPKTLKSGKEAFSEGIRDIQAGGVPLGALNALLFESLLDHFNDLMEVFQAKEM